MADTPKKWNVDKKSCEKHKKRKRGPLSEKSKKEKKAGEECGICLEPVKRRGRLDACSHVFCYSCISRWTKRSSSCPHCKRDITTISKTDPSGENIDSVHSVRRRTLRDTLDREEVQQRRRQHSSRLRRQNRPLNTDLTRQLLTVHQVIRNNMARLSSGLRGLQENLNSLAVLNSANNAMGLSVGLCNLPLNLNVALNGQQLTLAALSGYGMNMNVNMNMNLPHHQHQHHHPQHAQTHIAHHQHTGFSPNLGQPVPFLPPPGMGFLSGPEMDFLCFPQQQPFGMFPPNFTFPSQGNPPQGPL